VIETVCDTGAAVDSRWPWWRGEPLVLFPMRAIAAYYGPPHYGRWTTHPYVPPPTGHPWEGIYPFAAISPRDLDTEPVGCPRCEAHPRIDPCGTAFCKLCNGTGSVSFGGSNA
jgi:hypothetical protein